MPAFGGVKICSIRNKKKIKKILKNILTTLVALNIMKVNQEITLKLKYWGGSPDWFGSWGLSI